MTWSHSGHSGAETNRDVICCHEDKHLPAHLPRVLPAAMDEQPQCISWLSLLPSLLTPGAAAADRYAWPAPSPGRWEQNAALAPSALPGSVLYALRSAILPLCSPCVTRSSRCVLSFFSLRIFLLHFGHSDLSACRPVHNIIVSLTPASLARYPYLARQQRCVRASA